MDSIALSNLTTTSSFQILSCVGGHRRLICIVRSKHLCSQVRCKVWFHVHLCITQIGNKVDSHCCPSKLMADLSPGIDAYLYTWLRLRRPINSIERRLSLNCWFSQHIYLILQLKALLSEITAIMGSPTLNCPKPVTSKLAMKSTTWPHFLDVLIKRSGRGLKTQKLQLVDVPVDEQHRDYDVIEGRRHFVPA